MVKRKFPKNPVSSITIKPNGIFLPLNLLAAFFFTWLSVNGPEMVHIELSLGLCFCHFYYLHSMATVTMKWEWLSEPRVKQMELQTWTWLQSLMKECDELGSFWTRKETYGLSIRQEPGICYLSYIIGLISVSVSRGTISTINCRKLGGKPQTQ